MYVCMYVRMHACMYVCMHVCMMYVCICGNSGRGKQCDREPLSVDPLFLVRDAGAAFAPVGTACPLTVGPVDSGMEVPLEPALLVAVVPALHVESILELVFTLVDSFVHASPVPLVVALGEGGVRQGDERRAEVILRPAGRHL